MTQILYSYIEKQNHDFLMNYRLKHLPDDFQLKILKYRRWQDAQLSLLGRLLLENGLKSQGLTGETKLNVHYTSYNKPYLNNKKIKFNISHSGDFVVCAITQNQEIGIDIEILEDVDIENFKDQMTIKEWEGIFYSNDTKRSFFNYWTQKEAILKAQGKGLSIPLKSFEVKKNKAVLDSTTFYLREIALQENYVCHIASNQKISAQTILVREFNAERLCNDECILI